MSEIFKKELAAFVGKDGYDPKIALLQSMLDSLDDRLTALERGDSKPVQKDEQPAMVERFRVFQYRDTGVIIPGHTGRGSTKVEIGEVVASPDGEGGWLVKLPNWRHWVCLTDNAYRALVDHNVRAGIWERT